MAAPMAIVAIRHASSAPNTRPSTSSGGDALLLHWFGLRTTLAILGLGVLLTSFWTVVGPRDDAAPG